jgi:hypothetical protein
MLAMLVPVESDPLTPPLHVVAAQQAKKKATNQRMKTKHSVVLLKEKPAVVPKFKVKIDGLWSDY